MQDLNEDELQQHHLAASDKRKQRASAVCPHCNKKGHTTTRSSKCLKYQPPPKKGTLLVLLEPRCLSDEDIQNDVLNIELLHLDDPDVDGPAAKEDPLRSEAI
jgi:hypothetical protein